MSNLFYTKRLLNFADQNSQAHAARLRERFAEHAQASLWGLWQGVFGMAAHQLMAVSAHAKLDDGWRPPEDCEVEPIGAESHRTASIGGTANATGRLCISRFLVARAPGRGRSVVPSRMASL